MLVPPLQGTKPGSVCLLQEGWAIFSAYHIAKGLEERRCLVLTASLFGVIWEFVLFK